MLRLPIRLQIFWVVLPEVNAWLWACGTVFRGSSYTRYPTVQGHHYEGLAS